MAQQQVQLRKIRDFGENFSDTFQFIKQEFKPLVTTFMLISLVFILGAGVLGGLYQQNVMGVLSGSSGTNSLTNLLSLYNGTFFLIMALGVLAYATTMSTIAAYMRLYLEHGVSPTTGQVWSVVLRNLLKTTVMSLLVSIVAGIGMIMCLAPGVYLAVVLAPFTFVIINENLSIGEAFSRCFDLIKNNFWVSLGTYIVLFIIIAIISSVIGGILGLVLGVSSLMSTRDVGDLDFGGAYIIVSTITNLLQYFFYIILFVAIGMNYYSLVEQRDGSSLVDKIDSIGQNINPNDTIEEQY